MPTANLNRFEQTVDGFDSIIILKDKGDYPCGVTLDVEGFSGSVIKAGHLLVRNKTTKVVKPLAVTEGDYASLAGTDEYFGINKTDILKSLPIAAVLIDGSVNAAAAAKHVGAEYPAAAKTALNNINFIY